MARRQHLSVTIVLALVVFFIISFFFTGSSSSSYPEGNGHVVPIKDAPADSKSEFVVALEDMPAGVLDGESIAPKLENATLKAELGRATWKFMHTMVARFPDTPTVQDRTALETFIHLFGRLYPCGDCARHFRQMLAQYPPQTSSRSAAAGWLCFVHNVVNERLEKPIFDCNEIGDFYDCGCGEEGKDKKEGDGATGEVSIELEKEK
ncbi:hypothetical protein S40285_05487 [Stachybotrys chlorohalonatus IBT 40285]|uniref:Sulfhydryl oxidase n=1 Tax=Stachybotrys chlorohalonatus (strain IBT 40285) TaxID=1283841 RepID=A0A084QJ53_STAC4|nr:hypothetical protein S40285_05487 [Stachybotrys chlorohalonata IBT 40285]